MLTWPLNPFVILKSFYLSATLTPNESLQRTLLRR